MTKTIEVKLMSSGRNDWCHGKEGEIFVVNAELKKWHGTEYYVIANNSTFLLRKTDVEVVANKFVTIDGVKYEVPAWATHVTRDGEEGYYKSRTAVFAWAGEPVWGEEFKSYCQPANALRIEVLKPYVEPKPVGHVFIEVK